MLGEQRKNRENIFQISVNFPKLMVDTKPIDPGISWNTKKEKY